jgi:hypothetical protein
MIAYSFKVGIILLIQNIAVLVKTVGLAVVLVITAFLRK